MQKTAGGTTVQYLYDFDGHQIAEVNPSGGWNRAEVYADGWHLATYSGGPSGTTNFPIADHLGSTRLVTAYPTPSIVECDDYYPFGEHISCGSSGVTPFEFTGYQLDSETNLDFAQARHYSSAQGRFMSPDPSGLALADPTDPQQLNLYAYVRNNPLTDTDPTGLDGGPDNDLCAAFGPPCVGLGVPAGGYGGGSWLYDASQSGPATAGINFVGVLAEMDSGSGGNGSGGMNLVNYVPGGCVACLPNQDPYNQYFGSDPIAVTNPTSIWDTININTSPWKISNGPSQVTVIECGGLLGSGCAPPFGPYLENGPTPPQWVTDFNLFPNSLAPIPFSAGLTVTKTFQNCVKQVTSALKSGSPSAANGFGQCVEGPVFQ